MDALQSFAGEIFADIGFVRASVSVLYFLASFQLKGCIEATFRFTCEL